MNMMTLEQSELTIRTIVPSRTIEYTTNQDNYPPIPDIDENKIKAAFGDSASTVKDILIPIMVSFLEKVPQEDGFQDHHDRRQWRSQLPKEERDDKEKNKFRVNHITSLFGAISLLSTYSLDPRLAQKIEKKHDVMFKKFYGSEGVPSYRAMKNPGKIDFLNWLDSEVLSILRDFSVSQPA